MTALRIGQGYDLHRLVAGRRFVLGGKEIEHDRGPLGHSDGDVVLHALCDAILGALALGDIGSHFPDTDPRWKGADSRDLCRHVIDQMHERGYEVSNADVNVHTEEPKIGPHREAIRASVAELLSCPVDDVSLKAKTNEGLDAIGRGEAIAATAVVLLRQRGDSRHSRRA